MPKSPTLFQEIYNNLRENILPSIMYNLNKMGMQYVHVAIDPAHSMCFFNHLGIPFPFDINELQTVKDDNGNDIRLVILNIRFDGEISISTHINIGQNGLATLGNTSFLFDDYTKMFEIRMENAFLFILSKELTSKAEQLNKEVEILENLLDTMKKIRPKITREILIEKRKNSK